MPIGKVLSNLRPTMGGRRRRVRKAPARKPSMMALRSMLMGGRKRLTSLAPKATMGGRRRRAPRRMGRGFLDTLKSGFNTAKDFVKDNRLLSRGIRMIPGKYSDLAAQAAELAGYGRRRRAPRVGGRIIMPAFYSTGLGGLAATA